MGQEESKSGRLGVTLGSRAFWLHPLLNVPECADMITAWISGYKVLGEFWKETEAAPGDAVAYGNGWGDVTFGIHIAPGRIATIIRHGKCGGGKAPKLILLRPSQMGKPFIGGVHLG